MLRCGWRVLTGLMMALGCWSAMAADIVDVYWDAAGSDPQLRAAAATRQAVQETPFQARALLLPTLSASVGRGRVFDFDSDTGLGGGFGRGGEDGETGGDGENGGIPGLRGASGTESSFATHDYSLALSQPLYNRAAQVQIQRAGSSVRQAEATYAAERQALIVRVAERYFNVLRDVDDLTFRFSASRAISRELEQARQRFEVGMLANTAVLEAQARYDLSMAEEIDARNQLAASLEALQEVTGKSYPELQGVDAEMPLPPSAPADPEAWVQTALQDNPNLISAAFGVAVARAAVDLERAAHYPTVTLTAGRFDTDNGRVETSGNRIGLQIVIPLYEGGRVSSRIREASYRYESAKENLERVQREVVRQVRNAYQALETARRRVQALTQAVVSSQSALEAGRAGFEVGTRTIVDVLNAERDYLSAQRDLSVSRYEYLVNRLRLLQAAGRIQVQDLEAINAWLRVPVRLPQLLEKQ